MSQEYTVKSWSAWQDRDNEGEPVRDLHGNFKGTVTFDEFNSEPVDATFKLQPNIGDKKYGDVVPYKTKSGNSRLKFQRADRPQEGQTTSAAPATKKEWQPRDDDRIVAQWAIGQAVQFLGSVPSIKNEQLELQAKIFFAMVDRVKGSSESSNPKATPSQGTPLNQAVNSGKPSGYDKFKASKPGAKVEQSDDEFEQEHQEALASLVNSGESFGYEDLPPGF